MTPTARDEKILQNTRDDDSASGLFRGRVHQFLKLDNELFADGQVHAAIRFPVKVRLGQFNEVGFRAEGRTWTSLPGRNNNSPATPFGRVAILLLMYRKE